MPFTLVHSVHKIVLLCVILGIKGGRDVKVSILQSVLFGGCREIVKCYDVIKEIHFRKKSKKDLGCERLIANSHYVYNLSCRYKDLV